MKINKRAVLYTGISWATIALFTASITYLPDIVIIFCASIILFLAASYYIYNIIDLAIS